MLRSIILTRLIGISGLIGLALSAGACKGGGPTDPDGSAGTSAGFSSHIQPIFDEKCVTCHAPGIFGFTNTGGTANNGLNLVSGSSYRSLVNQPTFQAPAVQPTLRVQPGSPEASYLMNKLLEDLPKEGARMPLDGPPYLSDAEIDLIRQWIARGAPND